MIQVERAIFKANNQTNSKDFMKMKEEKPHQIKKQSLKYIAKIKI